MLHFDTGDAITIIVIVMILITWTVSRFAPKLSDNASRYVWAVGFTFIACSAILRVN